MPYSETMETLASRVIERCEELPENPPAGNYVIIDVIFFSTTVVELFENGAASLHVVDEKPETLDYKADNPDVFAGGNRTDDFQASEVQTDEGTVVWVRSQGASRELRYAPEPGAGWLVLAAVGALGALGRRGRAPGSAS